MLPFITEYKHKVIKLKNDLDIISLLFQAMAYAESYIDLVTYAMEGCNDHPEVNRVPDLRYYLLDHLREYPVDHVKPSKRQIFDVDFVGSIMALEDWQESGYYTERTTENYEGRVAIFEGIWHKRKVKITVTRKSKKGKIFTQAIYYNPNLSYEETIARRNESYGDIIRYIPFWLPLNYGTGNVPGSENPGYPEVDGIYFIEKAEQNIDVNLRFYARQLDRFCSTYLDIDTNRDPFSFALDWIRPYATRRDTYGIDIFQLAEAVTLN